MQQTCRDEASFFALEPLHQNIPWELRAQGLLSQWINVKPQNLQLIYVAALEEPGEQNLLYILALVIILNDFQLIQPLLC